MPISKRAEEFERKWLKLHSKASKNDKLFLEIMTFAFFGTQSDKTHVAVIKSTEETFENGKKNTDFTYTIKVKGG